VIIRVFCIQQPILDNLESRTQAESDNQHEGKPPVERIVERLLISKFRKVDDTSNTDSRINANPATAAKAVAVEEVQIS
jgi:hypothetical protein